MPDNYEKCTVEPMLPATAVSAFERILLMDLGFGIELSWVDGKSLLYLFAEESLHEEYEFFDTGIVKHHAALGDKLAEKLLPHALECEDNPNHLFDAFISSKCTWETLLQGILNKPECAHIDDIRVMAAYTCSKMRPGEFGGWVIRISRDGIQYGGTYHLYEKMREEQAYVAALELVLGLAEGNCVDQANPEVTDSDADPNDPLVLEYRKQKEAIERVCRFNDLGSKPSGMEART